MGDVIQAEDVFKDRRAVVHFARLSRLRKAGERALRDDPKKFLDAAGAEILRLRRTIEAAYEILHPTMSFVPPEPGVMAPYVDDSRLRCERAGDLLWRGLA